MIADPIVEEVRTAGKKFTKEFDDDIHKVIDYLKKQEKKHKQRLIYPEQFHPSKTKV